MTRRTVRLLLGTVFVLGVLARIWAWKTQDVLHFDEYFQVLEPAHWRLTGVGLVAWEWDAGLRSWALPGYHGAWMALLRACGVRDGATIGAVLQLHWAVVNTLIVLVGFRGGVSIARRMWPARPPFLWLVNQTRPGSDGPSAPGVPRAARPHSLVPRFWDRTAPLARDGWQGGLLAALLCALFPQLFLYAHHTLSENPATLCLVTAVVLVAEIDDGPRRDGWPQAALLVLASGGLFSLGVCLKIAWAPLALIGPVVLIVRRRVRLLGWMVLGAVPPLLLFGLLDLWTWGTFLGSFVRYLKFNFIEDGAAKFGVEPWHWYAKTLFERLPLALPILLLPALAGWRATWPHVVAAAGLVLVLSTQAHKEERFMIVMWPLLLIAGGGYAGGWLARHLRKSTLAAALAGTGAILADAGVHASVHGAYERKWLKGQAAAARDPEAGALMTEATLLTGGALWYSGRGPVLSFDEALLGNDVVTHVLVHRASEREQKARAAGFVRVGAWADVVLLKRVPK